MRKGENGRNKKDWIHFTTHHPIFIPSSTLPHPSPSILCLHIPLHIINDTSYNKSIGLSITNNPFFPFFAHSLKFFFPLIFSVMRSIWNLIWASAGINRLPFSVKSVCLSSSLNFSEDIDLTITKITRCFLWRVFHASLIATRIFVSKRQLLHPLSLRIYFK